MPSSQEQYDELAYYTLAHQDPNFIHQYIVDAYTAQIANRNTKPIALAFALIGLYLHLEKSYSGREVQLAHMQLAKKRRHWPIFDLPPQNQRGEITISDVLNLPPGQDRDAMIGQWCASVWKAYSASHKKIIDLLQNTLYHNQ